MSDPKLKCPSCGCSVVSRHQTTDLPVQEGDVWAPRREEGYQCRDCRHIEACFNDSPDYEAFRTRWNDPIETLSDEEHQAFIDERLRLEDAEKRAWTWPTEYPPDSGYGVTDRARRAEKLQELRVYSDYVIWDAARCGETLPPYKYGYPVDHEHVAAVLAAPDDDAPRWAYARWLRTFDNRAAQATAEFIEWQLRSAEALRADPRADLKAQLPDGVFSPREQSKDHLPDLPWWRYPGHETAFGAGGSGLGISTLILTKEGLVDNEFYVRGFIEHAAIKAHRFLEIADELYSLAPIRHLTITYCKGFDHKDEGLFRELLASPHLDRIHSLKLPVRIFGQDNEYTELNRLTDADIERLADSDRLRKLAYLNLEDQSRVTERGFEALATSPKLPMLSYVGNELLSYSAGIASSWGPLGRPTRALGDRPLRRYGPLLEARLGRRIPWLHPLEAYGTETPDVEAVVAHPVARAAMPTEIPRQ